LDVIKDDETQEGALQYNLKSPPKRRGLGENWCEFFLKGLCCMELLELRNLRAKILRGKDLSKPQTFHQE